MRDKCKGFPRYYFKIIVFILIVKVFIRIGLFNNLSIKKGKQASLKYCDNNNIYSAIDRMKFITIQRSSSPLIFFSKFGISSLPINDL